MKSNNQIAVGRAILAAAYIALGIVLIVHPGFTGIVICRAAGVLALAFGAVRALSALRTGDGGAFLRVDLIFSVLLLAFGIFALTQPAVILSVLPVVLGIYLLMESVGKFQRASTLKRLGYTRWWIVLLFGILAAALGVLLLLNPFQAAESMLIFLGFSLVADGVTDLWILWCFAAHGG